MKKEYFNLVPAEIQSEIDALAALPEDEMFISPEMVIGIPTKN